MDPAERTQINLCIEFGTSKIQVGYTHGDERDVTIVKGWEGGLQHLPDGTRIAPACIANRVIIDGEKKFHFGHSFQGEGLPGSKHMVDGGKTLTSYSELVDKCKKNDISTHDLLTQVFRLSLQTATRQLNESIKGQWEFRKILFPVPAAWAFDNQMSTETQEKIQAASKKAGFRRDLDIVVESEVVAALVETHYKEKISRLLENRSSVSVLIADIGDGTCDYSHYYVQLVNGQLVWLLAQKSRGFGGGIGMFWMLLQNEVKKIENSNYESLLSAKSQVFTFGETTSDITVAGTTISKSQIDEFMEYAFGEPLQELATLCKKSDPKQVFVAGQCAASSIYMQSRIKDAIPMDTSQVEFLLPEMATTAVIEGALMPEPEMNVKEEFKKSFFGIIYMHSRKQRNKPTRRMYESLHVLKKPMENIQPEWHKYIAEDPGQFRVIPGYTFNASDISNASGFVRIPGEQVIVMDSLVFKLPEETHEVGVRVRVINKVGDIMVEVFTGSHIYSHLCSLNHCRRRIILETKSEIAECRECHDVQQEATTPGDENEVIIPDPDEAMEALNDDDKSSVSGYSAVDSDEDTP